MLVYQGCRRGLTDVETTIEDTHIWAMNADGSNRREFVTLDNRQGEPEWTPEGDFIYYTVQERGNVRLYRNRIAGGKPEAVVAQPGSVTAFSLGRGGCRFAGVGSLALAGSGDVSIAVTAATSGFRSAAGALG